MNTLRLAAAGPLQRNRLVLTALACLAALLWPGTARASTVQARTVVGVVKSIDRKAKEFRLQPITPGETMVVRWDWQTLFSLQGQRVQPHILQEGTRAEVRYHTPLFGRKYATDVKWQ